jgi:YidC/Oxa1 family membrane protein insertase
MEKRKLDLNTIIGIVLIGAIIVYMMYRQPSPEQIEAEKAKTEQVEEAKKSEELIKEEVVMTPTEINSANAQDTLAVEDLKGRLGSFAYSGTLASAKDATTVVENDVLKLTVSNKGGQIVEAMLKQQTIYTGEPVYLVKDGNNEFNLQFSAENRSLNSKNLYFEPTLSKDGENEVLSMKLKTSENSYLEYRYELKPGEYMLDFYIRSQGLDGVINTAQPIHLDWNLKGYRHAKSIAYENRYTRLTYEYENGNEHSKLSPTGEDEEIEKDVIWMNFRQHFFSSMLFTDRAFKEVKFTSEDLVIEETVDTVYTKQYGANMLLEPKDGSISYDMNMYYGPTDYKIFKKYDRNLDEAMPLGWAVLITPSRP